jgi:hypothetical protein
MAKSAAIVYLLLAVPVAGERDVITRRDVEAERRALNYLAGEVPKWSKENKCFSCHNNGDATRALYMAARQGYALPEKALADTTAWLQQPERWDHNGGEGPYSDRKLARLHFAAALTDAVEAGLVKSRKPLKDAASLIAEYQQSDGSWQVIPERTIGSPVTHGNVLATGLARRTLAKADSERFHGPIAKADNWLRRTGVRTVLDAASMLLALMDDASAEAATQRQRSLELIRAGQSPDGGWGPTVKDPPEVFDTAVVVLALAVQHDSNDLLPLLRRGRAFLLASQKEDGSWPETTRPSGAVSYAQRISTTAWAAMALMATVKASKAE